MGLFDANGTLRQHHPADGLDEPTRAHLAAEVGTVLRRGTRAGSTLTLGGTRFTLQTLGRGGHLRGAIVIAGGDLDLEGRGVVTSVIAMAGLALEQNVGLGRARTALRAGLVHSLLSGEPHAGAPRRARAVGTPFPLRPCASRWPRSRPVAPTPRRTGSRCRSPSIAVRSSTGADPTAR